MLRSCRVPVLDAVANKMVTGSLGVDDYISTSCFSSVVYDPSPSIVELPSQRRNEDPAASPSPDTNVPRKRLWSGLATVYRREVLAKRLSTNSELPLFPRRSLAGRGRRVNLCKATS